MARSSTSTESSRVSKRKGTRSVSTLTPSQLARKRANDREAQRAIRARTKDHIDRLEQELDELRSTHGLNRTVQDLMRRNKLLEEELIRIKESVGITVSPYTSAYDDNLSSASGAMPSPRTSPFPSAEYAAIPDYHHQHYVPMPNNCETWASTVSSPSSTTNTEEYGAPPAYIPTSMPATMLPSHPPSNPHKAIKMEYEELDERFRLANPAPMPFVPQQQDQQQQWGMYPMYYAQQIQSPVH